MTDLYDTKQLERVFDIISTECVPVTERGIRNGEGIFGGAILLKSDLSLVCSDTNAWSKSPLRHGETECLSTFWRIPKKKRPEPKDCIFVSTHESCPLCYSALCWSGFDTVYYFFTHQDSATHFGDPVDAHIMQEVWKRTPPDSYERKNGYFTAVDLNEAIKRIQSSEAAAQLEEQSQKIWEQYRQLWRLHEQVQKSVVREW